MRKLLPPSNRIAPAGLGFISRQTGMFRSSGGGAVNASSVRPGSLGRRVGTRVAFAAPMPGVRVGRFGSCAPMSFSTIRVRIAGVRGPGGNTIKSKRIAHAMPSETSRPTRANFWSVFISKMQIGAAPTPFVVLPLSDELYGFSISLFALDALNLPGPLLHFKSQICYILLLYTSPASILSCLHGYPLTFLLTYTLTCLHTQPLIGILMPSRSANSMACSYPAST